MSEPKKQERDYTKEVNELLPEVEALVKARAIQEALDRIYVLEKQTRNAADIPSTRTLANRAIGICYEAKQYGLLNTTFQTLTKKHGQIKGVIQSMVEDSMPWLDHMEGETKLEFVKMLREVTEGRIFLETPRARLTLILARHEETLGTKEALEKASELLSDLQVETYSSMERREKTDFILEQMRLLAAIGDWSRVKVGSRKINQAFLKEEKNEDLKLRFYDLMIRYSLELDEYLEICKHYYAIRDTPSIKADEQKSRLALENIAYFIVLAPHDNEQSDMINRLNIDPALTKLQLQSQLIKSFVTPELMRWPNLVDYYGETLRKTAAFAPVSSPENNDGKGDKRWKELHKRVIEHNIRIIAKYYTRIHLKRLTQLLDLTPQETEDVLCRLVVDKTVYARIDRPAGIVNFKAPKTPEDVMNDFSGDMAKLLGLVEKTWMSMNAALAAKA
ncbi:hypothetical protein DACRYDRAFT_101139 [Dacryopinax primogenitus]|uniref:PCI domain-containing protein n=1 Tax=Dacryopinax primogenitus (strain DJM 731) TaxID=1858805 RepID=M5FS13_DACPD|nr:uncharacterized protein DACRYDRAFT_101139 [Dacryopinax primogenitus]EJU00081.1 hypothetical protein DACRYDRAFT_101139 [Dacryopinax primogenitus]